MYVHTHRHTRTHIHTHTHAHTHTYEHTHIHTHAGAHTVIHIHLICQMLGFLADISLVRQLRRITTLAKLLRSWCVAMCALCCSVLQCVAVCCSVTIESDHDFGQVVAFLVCCSVCMMLQCVAV